MSVESVTVRPEGPALAFSVTVQLALSPPYSVDGALRLAGTAAATVSAPFADPKLEVAVTVATVSLSTARVGIANEIDVLPAGIFTAFGTVAASP